MEVGEQEMVKREIEAMEEGKRHKRESEMMQVYNHTVNVRAAPEWRIALKVAWCGLLLLLQLLLPTTTAATTTTTTNATYY